ncbi:phosphoribosylformylglycinamidine cyclo-ligase [Liquorilactobacillus oeni]|uniref:Phosphoribosylformylglycinamidine cyclo-ligase n=1 Tax=Liquorilactobacillus oeni DSM 19972 TaxID=1423777 RepID=A0A0R1M9W3_9LACO|nr:phosphoribosylformylglycinamidine cyclo-ligase [Liquorilactobacillus oeni]KRL04960.1 phosphoribosylformylglycinamidine cyclo-ligase [Liquorilactobacillus oeni DSM 19972]
MNRYQQAGVDVNAGYELVRRIRSAVASTERPGCMGEIGSFGGLFDLGVLGKMEHPILVSGTDGVGTKLLIAQQTEKHETIGIDCVAMCVNDILAQGAQPLYFMDYIAVGHNNPERIAQIVQGVATGCKQAHAVLNGGETAEMPDMYSKDEYDLAGFAVGVAEKEKLLTKDRPQEGDLLFALPSSGLHSNGFSLVRQIIFKEQHLDFNTQPAVLDGKTIAAELLKPTKIYVRILWPLIERGLLNGISHITGGGLIENLPRMFADDLQAVIQRDSWNVLPIFKYLAELGRLTLQDCFETFNMGLGMVLAVSPDKAAAVRKYFEQKEECFYEIGSLCHRPEKETKIRFK